MVIGHMTQGKYKSFVRQSEEYCSETEWKCLEISNYDSLVVDTFVGFKLAPILFAKYLALEQKKEESNCLEVWSNFMKLFDKSREAHKTP